MIRDMRKPKFYFDNKPPRALVVWAFDVPGYFPQSRFFEKMGFKRASAGGPLLYYPLEKGYRYLPKERRYIPQEEDKGKVLLFYEPSCPFCIYFIGQKKRVIREVAPNIPIETINILDKPEEFERRGGAYHCIVNMKPIKSSIINKEKFREEVIKALTEN